MSKTNVQEKKKRNKEREKLIKELRLTPQYYIRKAMLSIVSGGLIGFGHLYLTSKSTLPEWISVLAAVIVAGGYFLVSHLLTVKDINEDVGKWNRWTDSDI
jgi:ABC-type xylose transport system permease subunit